MSKFKNIVLGTSLALLLSGCGEESPHVVYIENGIANFRNVDHNLHTYFNITGNLKVSFYEHYVKIENESNKTVHYVPLDKVVYIGDPIKVN